MGFKADETFEPECKALVLAIAFLGLSKILRSSLMEAALDVTKRRDAAGLERQCGVVLQGRQIEFEKAS
jgi:hypothetical protein